ncbi:penicillin-binding protein [Salisediminibacterium halotolerans]|uniref:serine-type D-Ala-D-Ala carboxypeptidase n=1 Tax=Salisediminibacterium halotolerans TaxID=517425 RepID=A0A1H9PW90_9BACI|nr:penicillin-binding protein [Salisediminibacterium haloalkalitolerans]SER51853.1 penicillin-binding protein 2B [Salisediminibacterium haloalkalitolerans]
MEQIKNTRITKRGLFFLVLFLFIMAVLFSRFVYIQAAKEVQDENLQSLLEERWSQTRELDASRGGIFDRDGEVLAEQIPSYSIYAVLDDEYDNYVADPASSAEALSAVLDADASTLEGYLSRDAEQVELGPAGNNLNYEERREIEELDLEGIFFREDPRRYYPNQTFASHVIGYTERDMEKARMGLEQMLDDELREEDGSVRYKQDGRQRPLVNADQIIDEPKDGSDVYLTIDSRIQMAIEQTMNQVDDEYAPERLMAVVASAETGEILGMSNRPSFNPNEYENIENYTNFNVSHSFEPGSTLKAFTLAGAIDNGSFDADAEFESGSYDILDATIHDHNNGEGWGEISYLEGVQRSSNVGFAKLVMDRMGEERMYDYLTDFGFRDPTGIDLPNEAGGLIAEQYPVDAVVTAFGQGSAVTPIQQVQAATALANDGEMMQPYIVDRVVDSETNEETLKNEPEAKAKPISAEAAEETMDILETVVSADEGTGRPFAIDGFEIAGKTGTAQIPNESGGGYMTGDGNNIYSFLGMAPAKDPEVIVYVAVDRPEIENDQSGNEASSMIFRQVMEQSLQYLNIEPDEESEAPTVQEEEEMPDVSGEDTKETVESFEERGYNVAVIGEEGTAVKNQAPEAGTEVVQGEHILLLTDDDDPQMPDITGWSSRTVFMLGDLMEMEVEIDGNGYAVEQTPEPGNSIGDASKMNARLTLEDEEDDESEDDDDNGNEDNEDDEDFFMD